MKLRVIQVVFASGVVFVLQPHLLVGESSGGGTFAGVGLPRLNVGATHREVSGAGCQEEYAVLRG